MADTRKRAEALLAALQALRTKYMDRGVRLKIVVDNDCWYVVTTRPADLDAETQDDLQEISARFDVGPEELACMFAIGLGFDAGRP